MPLSVIVVTGCRPSAMLWDAEVPTWAPEHHHPPRQRLVCNWYRFQAFCKWKALADNGQFLLGSIHTRIERGRICCGYKALLCKVNPSFLIHRLRTSSTKKFRSTSLEIPYVTLQIHSDFIITDTFWRDFDFLIFIRSNVWWIKYLIAPITDSYWLSNDKDNKP